LINDLINDEKSFKTPHHSLNVNNIQVIEEILGEIETYENIPMSDDQLKVNLIYWKCVKFVCEVCHDCHTYGLGQPQFEKGVRLFDDDLEEEAERLLEEE